MWGKLFFDTTRPVVSKSVVFDTLSVRLKALTLGPLPTLSSLLECR